jgi:hypothetical protein
VVTLYSLRHFLEGQEETKGPLPVNRGRIVSGDNLWLVMFNPSDVCSWYRFVAGEV